MGSTCSRDGGLQACSQDFSRGWGEGWVGAHLENRDQIINVRTIRYASSAADIQRRVSNLQTIKLKLFGATFNGTEKFGERQRREALGGFGGMPPPPPKKNFKFESLKRIFPALPGR